MVIQNPAHFFYACNGHVLQNMDDLVVCLRDCDSGTFYYHANEHKNDFANWVRDILQQKTLSNAMFKATTQKQMLKLVYDKTKVKKKNKKAIISQIKHAVKNG
jgi:hypothetical protein